MSKIMPVVACTAVRGCMSSPRDYANATKARMGGYGQTTLLAVAQYALRALEEARAADVASHEANLVAIEANKAVREEITALNERVGMPQRFSVRDPNSRARYPKSISQDAGYLQDLRRHVPISDEFEASTSSYATLLERYQAFLKEAEGEADRERLARERAEQAATARRRADMDLAQILVRYGLGPELDWEQVLETLRAKDQRLDLAVAMCQTRGDWSEGPYRVRSALGRFSIQSDEDKDIVVCVTDGLLDFEDGRVFRDMAWNYDRLFASVADKQLAADVAAAAGQVQ
jgi:hypothetical protein